MVAIPFYVWNNRGFKHVVAAILIGGGPIVVLIGTTDFVTHET